MPYRPVVDVEAGTRGAAVLAMAAIGLEPPPLEPSALGVVASPDLATTSRYCAAFEQYQRWSGRWADGYKIESDLSEQHPTEAIN